MKYENGREVSGSSIIIEWAKGNPRRPLVSGPLRYLFVLKFNAENWPFLLSIFVIY